jgi:hypothetical protein
LVIGPWSLVKSKGPKTIDKRLTTVLVNRPIVSERSERERCPEKIRRERWQPQK